MKRRYLLLLPCLAAGLACCSSTPGTYVAPWNVSAGFFGAQVTVGQPGYVVPAKVVTDPEVSAPVLMVPPSAPVPSGSVVPVTTAAGHTTSVPVQVASVAAPILVVPPTTGKP